MRKAFVISVATILCIAAQAAEPVIPRGKIAVFKAGTPDLSYPMASARVAPCFVQVFDPVTNNQSSPLIAVAMSTNASVEGSVWINHHAGSEGGGLSRTTDRRMLVLEGYTGNILSPAALKPSTDQTVSRGIVTLDAFANATSAYSDLANWFGIPAGSASGTQDNPTGIASTDGASFWGTGNFAGTSGELDGTLFYNASVGSQPYEVQNYVQAAAQARIIGGTLYVVDIGVGVLNFVDPSSGNVVPLPYDPDVPNPYQAPAFTNLFLNWGSTFTKVANFDMDAAGTIAYGADQANGIAKFTNNAGAWVRAPYYFSPTNLGTLKQASKNRGCFGICVDFSGANPVIYATTMENGYQTDNSGTQGHQNQNRLIRIVDTGANPGTNVVAQTLATATTTNEFFGGIDFTPDLFPVITMNPVNYATTNGGSAPFSVGADCAFPVSYQWLQNANALTDATNSTLTLNSLTTDTNGFAYQCVVADQYGSVTSTPAILTVTATAVKPVIASGTNNATGYIDGWATLAPVSATGTQPFTYQWYQGATPLTDDGVKYSGSAGPSLTISNLTTADSGNYYVVVMNSAGYASNLVDVLTVKYHLATINAGLPQSVVTFVGVPTSLTAGQTGATLPVTNQWYKGATLLTDSTEFSGTGTDTLTINATTTSDTANNYYLVVKNAGGSVTSVLASVTVLVAPPASFVGYSNQVYRQNFDGLPDPGGVSVNSFNNPYVLGAVNGVAYSLANPFDFAYPVISSSYLGGLGLSLGPTNMNGWYGAASKVYFKASGNMRFAAQDGDQTTGGVIDSGPNDVNGGLLGTNRALGLLSTDTTGPTAFALKLINTSANILHYINVSFLGELWHNGTSSRTMSFGYVLDDTAASFVLTPEAISNSTPVASLDVSFPTATLVTTMDGTLPANQTNLVANGLPLSGPWQPGAALWLIWSIDYYGSGSGNGYAIDNFSFSAASALPVITPLTITSDSWQFAGSGTSAAASFTFTNGPYLKFSVLATNDIAAPKASWPVIGTAVESPAGSGNYQFTDPNPTNAARFYRLRQP